MNNAIITGEEKILHVVLDFDGTLVRKETRGQISRISAPDLITDAARLCDMLRQFLSTYHYVSIATFGRNIPLINNALQVIGLSDEEISLIQVMTPRLGINDNNKNEYISALAQSHGIESDEKGNFVMDGDKRIAVETLLVDNSPKNIGAAAAAGHHVLMPCHQRSRLKDKLAPQSLSPYSRIDSSHITYLERIAEEPGRIRELTLNHARKSGYLAIIADALENRTEPTGFVGRMSPLTTCQTRA